MAKPKSEIVSLATDSEQDSYTDTDQDIYTEGEFVPKDTLTIAEEKKIRGNEHYKAQNYQEAINCYSEAIYLCPTSAAYYGNRSAAYLMMANYSKALKDARNAIRIDPNFQKAYSRIAKSCLALGDTIGTEQALKRLQDLNINDKLFKAEQVALQQLKLLEVTIHNYHTTNSYRNMLYYLDTALKMAPACERFHLLKAECLAFLGRANEAVDIAVRFMKLDNTSVDAIYVRGVCLYFTDNLEKSIMHFERALQMDPDHKRAKEMHNKSKSLIDFKESGNMFFKSGRYHEAHVAYSEALKVDGQNKSINSKLLYNRALVNSKIGSMCDSITDCTLALDINSQYWKALLLRARCNFGMERYAEAVVDYEKAATIQKTPELQKLLREAKHALKLSKYKDYYKILGVPRSANEDDIKKAYRKKALVHHPDRHASSSAEKRKDEELKFKQISEAYTVLSDKRRKARYDSGQDVYEQEPDFDPNKMFRNFFQFSSSSGQSTFGFEI